jgi:hypothetical protein
MDEPYIQESWDFVYEYTYCDQCGSFDLGVSLILPVKIDRAIVIAILVSFLAMGAMVVFETSIWSLGLLIGCFSLVVLVLYKLKTSRLTCNKCGNVSFSPKNVLNYTPNDESVIDVPERAILKKHIDTINV